MTFMENFEKNLYRPVIYTLLFIVVIYFVLFPIGLPMKVGERPKTFLARLNEIPDGSVVWFGVDVGAGGLPELRASMVAMAKYFFSRPLKIVFASPGTYEGPAIYNILLNDAKVPATKKYGTDYVYLGYIAGEEAAYASLAKDIRSLLSVDYYGTPLNDLPIFTGVNSAKDFAFCVTWASGQNVIEGYLRQWTTTYNTKLGVTVLSVIGPAIEPYYPTQIVAMLSSAKQGAEFELLLGYPGYGLANMDAQSAAHIMLLGFIIIGNVYTIIKKRYSGGK